MSLVISATEPSSSTSTMKQKKVPVKNVGKSKDAKRKNFKWKGSAAESALLDWLEVDENYKLYKGSGKANAAGKMKTTGKNRKTIIDQVLEYLKARGVEMSQIDNKKIKNKLQELENQWKEANALVKQTGEGIEERNILCTRFKVNVSQRPGMLPLFIGDNMDTDDIQQKMFATGVEDEDNWDIGDYGDSPTDQPGDEQVNVIEDDADSADDTVREKGEVCLATSLVCASRPKPNSASKGGNRGSKVMNMTDVLKSFTEERRDRGQQKLDLANKKLQMKLNETSEKNRIRMYEAENRCLLLLLDFQKAGIQPPDM